MCWDVICEFRNAGMMDGWTERLEFYETHDDLFVFRVMRLPENDDEYESWTVEVGTEWESAAPVIAEKILQEIETAMRERGVLRKNVLDAALGILRFLSNGDAATVRRSLVAAVESDEELRDCAKTLSDESVAALEHLAKTSLAG